MHDPDRQYFPSGSISETFGDQRDDFFEKIVSIAPSILYVFDLVEMRNIWVNRSMFLGLGYSAEEITAFGSDLLSTLMHPDDMARYPDHFAALKRLKVDEMVRFEYRIQAKNGEWHWLMSEEMAFTFAPDGSVTQIVGSAHDVTLEHEREEKISLLVREVNHRIKNLFSVIMSMISLTLKTKKNVPAPEAFDAILGRVNALAVAQSLSMPSTEAEPASCLDLIARVLAPYTDTHEIEIGGENPLLSPDQTTSVAMVLHEMATNATKYGSLSQPDGTLFLDVNTTQNDVGLRHVLIKWTEEAAPGIRFPESEKSLGFGSKLIERSMRQIDGSVEYRWLETGLAADLVFPMVET